MISSPPTADRSRPTGAAPTRAGTAIDRRPAACAARAERLSLAYATLLRGSDFLAVSLRKRAAGGCGDRAGLAGAGGAKVIGNGLRELDRFLSLLIDEAAAACAPASFDQRAFVRRSNVANKLRCFQALSGLTMPSGDRLRAIGRVRACLHHCRGIVHDPALRHDVRTAAGARALIEPADANSRLAVTFDELTRICRFYADAGAALMAACRLAPPASLTFPANEPI